MNKFFVAGLAFFVSVAFSSCASVPMASLESSNAAKKFKVPANTSRIYLYRNESLGAAIKIPISVDGQLQGQTAKNVFFYWDVPAGPHTLTCSGEATSETSVKTTLGKAVYVWQEMKMGVWSASCLVQQVDDARGQAGVSECELGQSNGLHMAPGESFR